MNRRLIVRVFFLGHDVALGRTWEFHDHLATRPDIDYRLHVIGRYAGPTDDLEARAYVVRGRYFAGDWSVLRPSGREVWVIRGWNHPFLALAPVLARWVGVPTLLWSERSGATWEAATLGQHLRIRFRQLLLPILFLPYRRNTIVLGAGSVAAEEFRRLSKGSPGRTFPYPNPVADACLDRVPARQRGEEPLLLFLGNFTRLKAVDLIADACEDLWRSGNRFRVRYVGAGPLRGLLEDHVRRNESWAEVCPFADRAALVEHLREADAVLLPSRRDGWGLPVHEGLASGIPVIVSNACGAADLITQSGCGRVVRAGEGEPLANAMAWVIGLPWQDREVIRDEALRVARQLTIPKLADTLLTYCREALSLEN